MSKTDKQLRYFVNALLKYAEKDGHFNSGFTMAQIPEIFMGWTELEFNNVHHGVGIGCCTCIGPDRYQINQAHCHNLQSKFKESRRSVIRLWLIAISIIVAIILGLLQVWNQYQEKQKTDNDNKVITYVAPPKK